MDNNPSDAKLSLWLWLFPVTYLIHIAEEYWGGEGYSAYLLRIRGVHLSSERFLVAQGVGLALLLLGVFLAQRLDFRKSMITLLGATTLCNGITHTLTSLTQGGYGPGLISSLLIWMPLGLVTLIVARRILSSGTYWLCVAIGAGINVAVGVFTMRGGKIV